MTAARLLPLAALALSAPLAVAQSTVPRAPATPSVALPPACSPVPPPRAPTAEQRRQARDLAQRGQQSAILGDRVVARDRLRLAAALDPTDADLAYQLARAEESTGATDEAAKQYCRFLALAPTAPDAAEARARVAELVVRQEPRPVAKVQERSAIPPRAPTPPRVATPARVTLSPGRALSLGLLVPGAGQFYAGRPGRGLLTMAGAGAALACGLRQTSTARTTQETALDPFGNPYTYDVTRQVDERPCLVPGIAAAGVIAIVSAIDAFSFARRANDGSRVSVELLPDSRRVELRVTVR